MTNHPTLLPTENSRTPTAPPVPPPNGSAPGWPGVAQEGLRQGGDALKRLQEQPSSREPRARASWLSILNSVAIFGLGLVVVVGGLLAYVDHQAGSDDYEERQMERHQAIMVAMAAQTAAISGLTHELMTQRRSLFRIIDVVAEHHQEAARVANELQREPVVGSRP